MSEVKWVSNKAHELVYKQEKEAADPRLRTNLPDHGCAHRFLPSLKGRQNDETGETPGGVFQTPPSMIRFYMYVKNTG